MNRPLAARICSILIAKRVRYDVEVLEIVRNVADEEIEITEAPVTVVLEILLEDDADRRLEFDELPGIPVESRFQKLREIITVVDRGSRVKLREAALRQCDEFHILGHSFKSIIRRRKDKVVDDIRR